jgi:ATP-dependent DNA helicase 2 subunit 2
MSSGKEAIIFILDSNHSMNVPYSNNADKSTAKSENISAITRFDAAKEATLHEIISMVWQNKSHEFGVVVLKTKETHHHMFTSERHDVSQCFELTSECINEEKNPPFPNLVEIEFTKPSHHLLNTIQSIRSTITDSTSIHGDFCDGLILAADTLYRRTNGRKYKRRIILLTDAEHEVTVDGEQLECVLNGLKKMECVLEVVGMGFREEGEFVIKKEEEPDIGDENGAAIDLCQSDEEHDEPMVKEESEVDDAILTGDADGGDIQMLIKRENEKLLLSLAEQTGGCVLAANGQDISSLLDKYHANSRIPRGGTRSTCEFKITPILTIAAKYSKIIDQKPIPSLKTDAYLLNETSGKPMVDGGGEFMTTAIDSIVFHTLALDQDNPDDGTMEVPQESRTDAYRFGSDLIPIGKMDMAGINAAFKSPKAIEMIGYIPSKDVISSGLTLGPAYALFGGKESKRSMSAVAALAAAMEDKGLWGLCRFVKSPNGDPRLAVLVPQTVEGGNASSSEEMGGRYLALLQLPFSDDVNPLRPVEVPLEDWGDDEESNVCDDLIDSLMIPDDQLDSISISIPAQQSYRRMIAHFAMNPITDEDERNEGLSEERILEACRATPLSELAEVRMLSKGAKKQIDSFLNMFPLVRNASEGKKPERKYWGDGN